ncbi:hypothetical protein BDZ94DRAFT_1266375 [Collybia nuda]|uniref:Uncharacterized protein n=1 Tax=Collybia nuda TaxID=64659 RepID=A0A9P5XYZ8_9AGAR|nr:hypothetical protein BDZ94DRAFT_1266375 [Collybia nuda]
MATSVERPMSALSDILVSTDQQRRPSIVEVIDVDLFDDPQLSSRAIHRPNPRQVQRPRQPADPESIISLVDSDDELPATPQMASGSGSTRQGNRQRLISPPPPTQVPHNYPPVPRVPRRFAEFVSPPMRRHPPPFAVPPVVPIAQPFPFEAAISQNPVGPIAGPSSMSNHPNRNRRYAVSPPLHAAPPSHHQPTLGLGGALISLNRARTDTRRDYNRYDSGNTQGGFINRTRTLMGHVFGAAAHGMGFGSFDYPEAEVDSDDDGPALHALLTGDDERFGHPARAYAYQEMMLQRYRNHARTQNIQYRPEYTHPGKPESGFTFDFAPPSFTVEDVQKPKEKSPPIVIDLEETDAEGSTAGPSTLSESSGPLSLNTLLVCARCLDPLVLGGGLVGEEGRRKKVWALRCGHMIDGKCLDILGVPSAEDEEKDQELEQEESPKGSTVIDIKGKGKAKAVEEPIPGPPPEENSMRSRLRSRTQSHIIPSSAIIPSSSSTIPTSTPDPPPQPPSPVKLGKRKRGKAAKPQIESTHEWTCPVAGCEKVHASVKIGGVWVPEPPARTNGNGKGKRRARWGINGPIPEAEETKSERGAIAVFV